MEKRKTMTKLIGISGKIGSGKDTFAEIIRLLTSASYLTNQTIEHFLRNPNSNVIRTEWRVQKFAGKLKEVASLLTGIPVYKFEDQDFKKTNLPEEWNVWHPNLDRSEPMTVRELLQKLGTEAMRNGLHTNAWVNATFSNYDNYSKWLITDVRFPNEAAAIIEKGGILVRLHRNSETGDHPSETALDNYDFQIVIENTGSLTDLIDKTREFCEKYNLLDKQDDYPPHTEGFF
jgi:hypothetical protein